jgi:hypothetical protein
MAGGTIVSATGGKEYPGKLTMFVFLTCIVAATGGLIFGYDLGISGKHITITMAFFFNGIISNDLIFFIYVA